MSVILLLLGVLLAAAGAAATGFGFLVNDLNRSATLILAGTFGFVGGLLLIGLAAVTAELARVRSALRIARPAGSRGAAAATEVAPGPRTELIGPELSSPVGPQAQPLAEAQVHEPAPGPSVEVSANAIERLRSTIPRSERTVPMAEDVPLSPNGQPAQALEPRLEPGRPPTGTGEPREPRLDFLLRPRQGRPSSQQQEASEVAGSRRPEREPQLEPRPEVARAAAAAIATASSPVGAVTGPVMEEQRQDRTVAILKSGVVDGMAYTLYADGSIEAQLPQGTVRFGSIAELRAHIESNA